MKLNFNFNTAVFIDASVENYQQLFDGVIAEAKPFQLDTATDGIAQIDQILQQHPEIKTIHIISHGCPGCLYLGDGQLSLDTLHYYASELQRWRLDNILLYGCNVAARDAGTEFIAKLHDLTGARIAASKSLTGATAKGGNWELEVVTDKTTELGAVLQGEVMADYDYVLSLELEWTVNIGSIGNDHGSGIATDSSDNILVTGDFGNLSEDDTIDINSDGINDLNSNGATDAYVVKFDSDGNLVFARNIGGSSHNDNFGYGIATDSSGNVLATGSFYEAIDIDSDGIDDLNSNGGNDAYVAKFDGNGNLVFIQNIGGSDHDSGFDIATDSSSNVLVAGSFLGNIDIDSDDTDDLTSNGGSDGYIAKFDSDGNLVFAQNIGGTSWDHSYRIATDGSDNILVAGFFQETIDINSDGVNDLTSNGEIDAYVVKFDSDGNLVFAQNIGGSSWDSSYGIATDSSGNVWVAGDFQGNTIDINSDGIDDLTSNGDSDGYLVKFDSDGNLLFSQNIGGSDTESIRAITTDSSGNVWVAGYFRGNTIDINSDGTDDLTSDGYFNPYIAKFDSDGNLLFAQNISRVSEIATDSSGNILLTGGFGDDINNFYESIDINVDGIDDLTSNGGFDAYVAKLSEQPEPPIIIGDSGENILNGGVGKDTVVGGSGNDTLNGGRGNDKLLGQADDDLLIGRPGNDILLGGSGDDILEGGIGRDRLNGGPGNDELNGGASIDQFIFNTNQEFDSQDIGIDQINDFNSGQDIIVLDLSTFTALDSSPGIGLSEDDFAIVSSDAATAEAEIVYNSASGALYYNTNGTADGFGTGAQFATLDGSPDLVANDFQVR